MNDKAAEVTPKEGGKSLIGKSLMECHPPKAQRESRISRLRVGRKSSRLRGKASGRGLPRTMERDGHVGGLVEIHFELPRGVPKQVRN
jgi:ribosomal protein L15